MPSLSIQGVYDPSTVAQLVYLTFRVVQQGVSSQLLRESYAHRNARGCSASSRWGVRDRLAVAEYMLELRNRCRL